MGKLIFLTSKSLAMEGVRFLSSISNTRSWVECPSNCSRKWYLPAGVRDELMRLNMALVVKLSLQWRRSIATMEGISGLYSISGKCSAATVTVHSGHAVPHEGLPGLGEVLLAVHRQRDGLSLDGIVGSL